MKEEERKMVWRIYFYAIKSGLISKYRSAPIFERIIVIFGVVYYDKGNGDLFRVCDLRKKINLPIAAERLVIFSTFI